MRTLIFDLETSPILAYTWSAYKIDRVVKVIEESKIISVAWKYEDEDKTYAKALPDFPGYKGGRVDDRNITRFIWDLIDGADLAVAHNGRSFDLKVCYARMFVHGMTPPKEPYLIDTRTESAAKFRFAMNSLDYLSQLTGGKPKVEHEGFPLWEKCMAGDRAAWKRMKTYNINDVVILEPYYKRLKPWIAKKFPNANLIEETVSLCRVPNCGGTQFQKYGYGYNGATKYQRLRCKRCGAPNRGRNISLELSQRPLIR